MYSLQSNYQARYCIWSDTLSWEGKHFTILLRSENRRKQRTRPRPQSLRETRLWQRQPRPAGGPRALLMQPWGSAVWVPLWLRNPHPLHYHVLLNNLHGKWRKVKLGYNVQNSYPNEVKLGLNYETYEPATTHCHFKRIRKHLLRHAIARTPQNFLAFWLPQEIFKCLRNSSCLQWPPFNL